MISGVVLAGGSSSRLTGGVGPPKQLLDFGGRPLLQHTLDAAAGAGLDELVVVLGYMAAEVAAALTLPTVARTVVNPDFATGQASSLRCGLAAAAPQSSAAVILLGDMPGMRAEDIAAVAGAFRDGAGPVVQARYRGVPSHPVLFARAVWPDLLAVSGDTGAREVMKAHPEWVTRVDRDVEVPPDLDTMEDYEHLRAAWGYG